MADQLTGRALDEAAAIAMGATVIGGMRIIEGYGRCGLARYSTDPATIPEMLAFLAPWWVAEQINHEPDVIRAYWDDGFELFSATGTTLNEALARLVVEVARARGKQ